MVKIASVLILLQSPKKLAGNIKPRLSEMKAIFLAELPGEVECRLQPLQLFLQSKLLSFFTKRNEKKASRAFPTLAKRNLLNEPMASEPFQAKIQKK